MLRKENYYQFELFCDLPVKQAVFTRHGGCSEGVFASLNLGFEIGDGKEVVLVNLKRAQEALGVDRFYSAKQCHGKGIWEVGAPLREADILVTNKPGCPILIKHADCQAAIIYDPKEHAAAGVHCGWRGSVLNVYAEAISYMQGHFGSRAENLLVGISPSLGPQSAEFIHYRNELPEEFWDFQVSPNYFDFWQISRFQLERCGVLPHHIEMAGIDTYSSDDFFSYRRSRVTGRNGTAVCLS